MRNHKLRLGDWLLPKMTTDGHPAKTPTRSNVINALISRMYQNEPGVTYHKM